MKLKKAFTLAEAILTMTILGVLAATMVSNLKPAQYRKKALVTKAQKLYAEVDEATNLIVSECTQDLTLNSTYTSCSRTGTKGDLFTTKKPSEMGELYAIYMKLFDSCASGCKMNSKNPDNANTAGNSKCYLTKNNANICFLPKDQKVIVDVNNNEGPNADGEDQHTFTLDKNGIGSAMPDYAVAASN